jgi:hypothetical protein
VTVTQSKAKFRPPVIFLLIVLTALVGLAFVILAGCVTGISCGFA